MSYSDGYSQPQPDPNYGHDHQGYDQQPDGQLDYDQQHNQTGEYAEQGAPNYVNVSSEARNWAMFCHLASFASFTAIPFGNLLGPLIVWLIKKDEHQLVDIHGRAVLNFQISCVLWTLVCIPLIFLFGLGILLLIALWLMNFVVTIVGAVKANNGELFNYPLSISFL